MSNDFESFIRPFQTGNVTPPRRILPTAGTKQPDNLKLEIGKGGGAKTFSFSASDSTTVYVEKFPKEV